MHHSQEMSESLRRRAWGFGPGEVRAADTDDLLANKGGRRGEVVFRAAGSLKNRLQPPDGDWSQTCLVFGVQVHIGTFPKNFGGKSSSCRVAHPARMGRAFGRSTCRPGPWGWRRARSVMDMTQITDAIDVEIRRLQIAKALLWEGSPAMQTSGKAVT